MLELLERTYERELIDLLETNHRPFSGYKDCSSISSMDSGQAI